MDIFLAAGPDPARTLASLDNAATCGLALAPIPATVEGEHEVVVCSRHESPSIVRVADAQRPSQQQYAEEKAEEELNAFQDALK